MTVYQPTAVPDVQVSDVQERNKKMSHQLILERWEWWRWNGLCVCVGGGGGGGGRGALGGERVPLKEIYFPIGERYDNTSR